MASEHRVTPKAKVLADRVHRNEDGTPTWVVSCTICDPPGLFGGGPLAGLFGGPWARAVERGGAIALARFHVYLHERDRCDVCGCHGDPIPVPVLRGGPFFTIGDDLYRLHHDHIDPAEIRPHTPQET